MKLTLKQRLKILFTGEMPELLIAVDKNIPTLDTPPLRLYDPVIDSPRIKRSHDNYATLAKKCRKNPNSWTQIATVPRTTAAPSHQKSATEDS